MNTPSLETVLLNLANAAPGPEYEQLKMMYLFLTENAVATLSISRPIQINYAMDAAFARFKKQNAKEVTSIDTFEQMIVNLLYAHEQFSKTIHGNSQGALIKKIAEGRKQKVFFYNKYRSVYIDTTCQRQRLQTIPENERRMIAEQTFDRLVFRKGQIEKPQELWNQMQVTIHQHAAVKGYAIKYIATKAPMPPDACAPLLRENVTTRRSLKNVRRLFKLKRQATQKIKQFLQKRSEEQPQRNGPQQKWNNEKSIIKKKFSGQKPTNSYKSGQHLLLF